MKMKNIKILKMPCKNGQKTQLKKLKKIIQNKLK